MSQDEVVGQQSGTMTRVSAIHSRQAADRDGSSEEAKEKDEKAKEGEKYRAKSVNEAVKSDQKKNCIHHVTLVDTCIFSPNSPASLIYHGIHYDLPYPL